MRYFGIQTSRVLAGAEPRLCYRSILIPISTINELLRNVRFGEKLEFAPSNIILLLITFDTPKKSH